MIWIGFSQGESDLDHFFIMEICPEAAGGTVDSNILILRSGFDIVYTMKKYGGKIWTLFSFRRN
ncbi:hypothetical protein [Blautia sp.]|nr:hypothetical protein [uncultured Blautia sp.]